MPRASVSVALSSSLYGKELGTGIKSPHPLDQIPIVWTAVWNKILTGDNLRGRGMDFVDW